MTCNTDATQLYSCKLEFQNGGHPVCIVQIPEGSSLWVKRICPKQSELSRLCSILYIASPKFGKPRMMRKSLIASCSTAGCANPKVVCGHLASKPWNTTLGQGSRLPIVTKPPKEHHVSGLSADSRHRGQLVRCKAEPSGRGAPSSTKISVPQSKEESVRTWQRRAHHYCVSFCIHM